jgi:hypothetical protein
MEFHDEEWGRKGATLSDKTARSEFGLTQDEIIAAIDAGKLQCRSASMHGNPWLRLLRREVEELVRVPGSGSSLIQEGEAGTGIAPGSSRTGPLPARVTFHSARCLGPMALDTSPWHCSQSSRRRTVM